MDEIYSAGLENGIGKSFEKMRKTFDGERCLKRIKGANLF